MAHHVFAGEAHEGDAFNAFENRVDFQEAGTFLVFEVDLRQVAVDDDFRVGAHAREEHFHLFGRRVLRLVQNNQRGFQRASAHVGERNDLDDFVFSQQTKPVGADDREERIVKRPQIRMNFLIKIAWQKSKLFARFHHGARQNNFGHASR